MSVTLKPVPKPKPQLRQTLSPAFFNALKTLEMSGEEIHTMLVEQAEKNPSIRLKDNVNIPIDPERMVQQEDERMDLLRQLHDTDCDQRIGMYLIDSLDSHGWFTMPITNAAKDLRVSVKDVKDVLRIIQTFEPAGVGAVSLENCLLLQINRSHGSRNLCKAVSCLELFAKGQFQKASKAIGCSPQEAISLFHEIQHLNPYPVHLGTVDAMILFPDVTVCIENEELTWSLYAWEESFTIADGNREQKTSARQLQKQFQARTILLKKIVDIVMRHQKAYFFEGTLRPLTASTIAKELNVSVSTVTRAMAHKAFEFEGRLRPLSDLLSPAAKGEIAQKQIMTLIRRMIEEEDPACPYSDQGLQILLQESGISIAKRTVTKYRLAMHILSYAKRRKY